MQGVFLDAGSVDLGDLDMAGLRALPVAWQFFEKTGANETAERISQSAIIITNKVVLDAAILRQARHLKLLCVAATGANNVDLETTAQLGITVCNVRAYGTASVSQHVFSLLLALSGSLLDYHADVRRGRWQGHDQFCFMDHPIHELHGKTLGIVGYGELGRGVAKLAEAFGMKVLIAQRPGGAPQPDRLPLRELLPRVDVLTLHCPLTAETAGLIGRAELAAMKNSAILINTARGGIVDEVALADALRAGKLGGAAVDVLSKEPPKQGNPLLDENLPRLIVTPHIAWAAVESRQRVLDQVVENIRAYLNGAALRVLT